MQGDDEEWDWEALDSIVHKAEAELAAKRAAAEDQPALGGQRGEGGGGEGESQAQTLPYVEDRGARLQNDGPSDLERAGGGQSEHGRTGAHEAFQAAPVPASRGGRGWGKQSVGGAGSSVDETEGQVANGAVLLGSTRNAAAGSALPTSYGTTKAVALYEGAAPGMQHPTAAGAANQLAAAAPSQKPEEVKRLRESLAEKEGAVHILRSRLAHADQELYELRQAGGSAARPQTHRQAAELQRDVERLTSQLAFKDQEAMAAKRLRMEKEDRLQAALATAAELQAKLDTLSHARRLEAQAAGSLASRGTLGEVSANGSPVTRGGPANAPHTGPTRANLNLNRNPGPCGDSLSSTGLDPFTPPFPLEMSSQKVTVGRSRLGLSPNGKSPRGLLKGSQAGNGAAPLSRAEAKLALFKDSGAAAQVQQGAAGVASEEAPAVSPATFAPAQTSQPPATPAPGRSDDTTAMQQPPHSVLQEQDTAVSADVVAALKDIWMPRGAMAAGASLMSRLYAVHSTEVYGLLLPERDSRGSKGGTGRVAELMRQSLPSHTATGPWQVKSSKCKDSRPLPADSSPSSELHEALAMAMSGLEPPDVLLSPLLALCHSPEETRAHQAGIVLRGLLSLSSAAREALLCRNVDLPRSDARGPWCSMRKGTHVRCHSSILDGHAANGLANGAALGNPAACMPLFSSPRITCSAADQAAGHLCGSRAESGHEMSQRQASTVGEHVGHLGGGDAPCEGNNSGARLPPKEPLQLRRAEPANVNASLVDVDMERLQPIGGTSLARSGSKEEIEHHVGDAEMVEQGRRSACGWSDVMSLAEGGAGDGVREEAVGALVLLVAHTEPLQERKMFESVILSGCQARLLEAAVSENACIQALHLLQMLLFSPRLRSRICCWDGSQPGSVVEALIKCLTLQKSSLKGPAVRVAALQALRHLAQCDNLYFASLMGVGVEKQHKAAGRERPTPPGQLQVGQVPEARGGEMGRSQTTLADPHPDMGRAAEGRLMRHLPVVLIRLLEHELQLDQHRVRKGQREVVSEESGAVVREAVLLLRIMLSNDVSRDVTLSCIADSRTIVRVCFSVRMALRGLATEWDRLGSGTPAAGRPASLLQVVDSLCDGLSTHVQKNEPRERG